MGEKRKIVDSHSVAASKDISSFQIEFSDSVMRTTDARCQIQLNCQFESSEIFASSALPRAACRRVGQQPPRVSPTIGNSRGRALSQPLDIEKFSLSLSLSLSLS